MEGNKISFVEAASEDGFYVTQVDIGDKYCVLVMAGCSCTDLFEIAMQHRMVCTGVNTIKAEEFDFELVFEHVDDIDILVS